MPTASAAPGVHAGAARGRRAGGQHLEAPSGQGTAEGRQAEEGLWAGDPGQPRRVRMEAGRAAMLRSATSWRAAMVAGIPVGSLGHLTQRYLSGDHKYSNDQPRGGREIRPGHILSLQARLGRNLPRGFIGPEQE